MFRLIVVVSLVLAVAVATDVSQCRGKSIEGLKEKIMLTPCDKLPCRLKRGTRTNITIHFTPDTDIENVINRVTAAHEMIGIQLDFFGVDGTPVCNKIETENGEKAPCPLKAGTKYVYKDSFLVSHIYPMGLLLRVHWALQNTNNKKDITCFEVLVKTK